MPLYEYKCRKCGHRFEKIENMNASMTKKCPKCGATAERMLAAPAIQFKGTGWYVTDYAGKSAAKNSGEASEGSSAGSGKKSDDSKGAETKSSETTSSTGNEGSKKRKK